MKFDNICEFGKVNKYLNNIKKKTVIIYSKTAVDKSNINIDNKNFILFSTHDITKNVVKIEEAINKIGNFDLIISIGGGTATDIGKYISFITSKKLVSVPTMLSTNAYATDKVALLIENKKTTINAKMPDLILIDEEIINISFNYNLYGLADVLSIHTALKDWDIAVKENNESKNEIYQMAQELLDKTVNYIINNDYETIISNPKEIFYLVGEAGHITNIYGNGKPESGSEHIFAKELEALIDVPHGIAVSNGIILMSIAQNNYNHIIFKCLEKLNIFDEAKKLGITFDIINEAFENVKPRNDRYSIVNSFNENNCIRKHIFHKFMELMKTRKKMLIVNDFFKRRKEAVSNQMEALLTITNGKIITATRFMKQKSFQKEDRKDNIFVYPPLIYHIMLYLNILLSKNDVHIFEEEPQLEKRLLFNMFNKDVYVSMYREPFEKYAMHLKKYKNLRAVYVEMDTHKEKLINYGIDENKIHVTYTPAKVTRKSNEKLFDPSNINLLFASWNNKEGNPLYERGLVYILDLLVKNPNMNLTVLLRDNKTKEFQQMILDRNLKKRVRMIDVTEEELENEFDKTDFVIFTIQKKLTKDVPNSLIDGISRGKPLIMTDVFGFSEIVKKEKIGIVIKPNTKPIKFDITPEQYNEMSKKAYEVSKKYTNENYVKSIIKHYEVK